MGPGFTLQPTNIAKYLSPGIPADAIKQAKKYAYYKAEDVYYDTIDDLIKEESSWNSEPLSEYAMQLIYTEAHDAAMRAYEDALLDELGYQEDYAKDDYSNDYGNNYHDDWAKDDYSNDYHDDWAKDNYGNDYQADWDNKHYLWEKSSPALPSIPSIKSAQPVSDSTLSASQWKTTKQISSPAKTSVTWPKVDAPVTKFLPMRTVVEYWEDDGEATAVAVCSSLCAETHEEDLLLQGYTTRSLQTPAEGSVCPSCGGNL